MAVLLGAGGVVTTLAATSDSGSVLVPIVPCRLVDTRAASTVGPRSTPLKAGTPYTATAWATNGDCKSIPDTATALSMNVTAVNPTAQSNLRVYPAGAAKPLSSNLNWLAGQSPTPNAVTVGLSTTGKVTFYNHAGTVDVVVDLVGYYIPSPPGEQGPAGPAGAQGDPGAKGDKGDPGEAAVAPAQVIWVTTSGGDYTLLSAALAAIGDTLPAATASKPYLIRIAPGVYTETSDVSVKDHVDVEGSGQGITTITCACDRGVPPSPTLAASAITEIRYLTVENTGGGEESIAIFSLGDGLSLLHVTAIASGGRSNSGVHTWGSMTMNDVIATASGGSNSTGIVSGSSVMNNVTATAIDATTNRGISIGGGSPTLNNVTATASGGTTNHGISTGGEGSPTMNNVTATATGGTTDYGVYNSGALGPDMTVRNAHIGGTTASIFNNAGTAKVADSTLDGAVGGGGFTCVGVRNAAFLALGAACT